MRNIVTEKTEVIKKHNNYQRYIMILVFMSAMVAGIVVLVLMQPAVTQTYTCGMEEHIHSIENGCYELICGMNEGDLEEDGVTPHVHSESCYDLTHTICGKVEHIHDQNCLANDEAEEDEVIEVTEAQTEPETTEAPTEEEITEETLMPEVVEIRDLDLGEIYALDTRTEELSAQQANELAADELAYDIYDDVEALTYDEDSDIAEDTEKENAVQLTLKFRVPNEAFENGNRIIYCELPEDVSLGKGTTARRYMSEAYEDTPSYEICRYKLDPKSNMLIMEFSEEQIGDGNCTIACKFRFDAIVEMDGPEAEEQTVKQGKASVSVKAPDMKGAAIANDAPSFSISKTVVEEGSHYNGGYHDFINGDPTKLMRRIRFRIEFEVRNGTNGKDLIFRDKLDTFINSSNETANLIYFDYAINSGSGKYPATITRTDDNGTATYNYIGYEWCDHYKINRPNNGVVNRSEFVIHSDDFINPNTGQPFSSVKYVLEYYAGIDWNNTSHFVEYGGAENNYASLYLGTVECSDTDYLQEGGDPDKEQYHIVFDDGNEENARVAFDGVAQQSVYRGYTISQSASSFDEKTDRVTWNTTLHRGYDSSTGEEYQLTGDIAGLAVSDNTLKNTDSLTVSDGTNSETYTAEDNDKTLGTFDKTNGKFTFKSGATENTYTFTYTNKADDARTVISSQPLFSRSSDGRWIAQSNVAVNYAPEAKRANIVFDDTKDNYDWKVTLQGTEGSFIVNGSQDEDEVTCNFDTAVGDTATDDEHYLIPADTIDDTFKLTFLDKNGSVVALERGSRGTEDYYVRWYSDSAVTEANEQTDTDAILGGTAVIRGVRIGLNNTENAQTVCDIIMEYKSASAFGTSTSVGTTVRFRNNIGWQQYRENSHWKTKYVEENKNKKFVVYDSSEESAESGNVPSESSTAVVHDSADTVQISNAPSVGWTIAGNVQAVYNNTDNVTFTYTLPSGVTLAADQIKYYQKQENNLVQLKDDSITFDEATSTFTVTPAARTYKDSPTEFRIMLKAKIDDLETSYKSLDPDKLSNGVPYKLDVVDSLLVEASQQQGVKISLIHKSGKLQQSWKSETYDDGYGNTKTGTYNERSHYIDFTLDVNPDALTINGGEKITVYDFMKNHKYTGVRLILVDLKVYQYVNGSSEPQLLDNSQYTCTASNASIEEDLSGTLRALDTNADPNGSWFYLKLDDATHYKVEYTYHYLNNNTTVDKYTAYDFNGYNVNTAKILDSSNNVIDVSKSITLTSLGRLYNTDTDDDSYAVIEAVSEDNYNVKIPGCYFAMLRYAGNNSWEVMTSSHEENGKIIPDTWASYTEIERGDTPETVRSKNHNCVLLGPTDSKGRTRLPELQTEGKFYRIVEVQPAAGYAVNPDKLYMTYLNTRPTAENQPNVLFYDQMTAVYSNDSSYNGNMVGTVIIENTGRGSRNLTLNKEWIDSVSTHENVTFDSFRSYETKSRSNVQEITFEMTDQNGRVGDVKTFYVSYGSSFIISIQNTGLATYADKVVFEVNGKSITPAHSNNPWYQEQDGIYSATIRNRVGDDESIVYYSYPASRNGVYPPGITCDGDASVWCKNVTRDYTIYLRANDYSVNSAAVIDYTPKTEKGEYDTFDNLPDDSDRLKKDNGSYAMTRLIKKDDGTYEEVTLPDELNSITVTIGETGINGNDPWTYKWYDLPEMDCYGFKYYYYVEEMPESPDTRAEDTLNRKYNSASGYEIRYYNNGAINSDTITVRNHESAFIKSLPATGGEGKDFYLGIGLSVAACAVLILISRKRSQGAERRP